jgi:transketolase
MKSSKIENLPLRDAFISTLQKIAEKDKKVILLTNDQGAPALDDFIKKLPRQFFNSGISEQNIIGTAAGLSILGFKPYVYSISSFIIYRTIEYIKIDLCSMKQPVTIVGVGSGYSYPEDGPTHHSTEDIALTVPLSNLDVFNPSDSVLTSEIVNFTYKSKRPSFVRLDRQFCQNFYFKKNNINKGFRFMTKSLNNNKKCIISSGFFISKLFNLLKKKNYDLIDFYRFKNYDKNSFIKAISKYDKIICIEEHSLKFGIGSIISEIITDNQINTKLKRMGLLEDKIFGYGSRDQLLKSNKLNDDYLLSVIKKF